MLFVYFNMCSNVSSYIVSHVHLHPHSMFLFSEREHPACPPPITPQQTQQAPPRGSHYTSLKRSASNMSSGTSTPIERKTESPKDFVDKSESSKQKSLNKVIFFSSTSCFSWTKKILQSYPLGLWCLNATFYNISATSPWTCIVHIRHLLRSDELEFTKGFWIHVVMQY